MTCSSLIGRSNDGQPVVDATRSSEAKTGRPDAAQQNTMGPSRFGTSVHTTPSAVTPEWGFSVSPRSSTSADASDKPVTSGGRGVMSKPSEEISSGPSVCSSVVNAGT